MTEKEFQSEISSIHEDLIDSIYVEKTCPPRVAYNIGKLFGILSQRVRSESPELPKNTQ